MGMLVAGAIGMGGWGRDGPAVRVLPLPGGPWRSVTSPLPLPATRSSSLAVLST